jgi:hypothetical protein
MIVAFNEDKREPIVTIYKEGEHLLKIIVASIKSTRK